MENTVCLSQCAADIVGNHDDSDAVLLYAVLENMVKLTGHDGIKAGHRLVQEQEFSRGAECPRKEYTLLLAA